VSALQVGSVTDNASPVGRLPVTRNAPRVEHGAYVTLAGLALDWNGGWVSCSICGGKSHWRHCATCHQQAEYVVSDHNGQTYPKSADHGSCFACGRCMPPRARGRYCSTTCRVRAHNYYHHTIAGQASLAELKLRSAAFWEASKRMFGGASPEWRRSQEAKHYGKTCGACGDDLADGEPIFLRRDGPVCRTCCPDPDAVERWGTRRWDGPLACDGCSRPVYFRGDRQRYRLVNGHLVAWAVCSTRCYQDVKHREAKVRKAAEREPINCAECGERVDARRRDARYCSNACRMVAYRDRKAGVETLEATP